MASESPLNEAQRRRLSSNARYADKLLSDIEGVLGAAESKSIFPKYMADLSPAQARLIRGYIARFRDQLARALDGLNGNERLRAGLADVAKRVEGERLVPNRTANREYPGRASAGATSHRPARPNRVRLAGRPSGAAGRRRKAQGLSQRGGKREA